jgi:hypothetical protein
MCLLCLGCTLYHHLFIKYMELLSPISCFLLLSILFYFVYYYSHTFITVVDGPVTLYNVLDNVSQRVKNAPNTLVHVGLGFKKLTLYCIANGCQTDKNCFCPVVNVFVRLPITRKTHRNRRHTVSTPHMYQPGTV